MIQQVQRARVFAIIVAFLMLLPLPFIPEYGANTTTRLMLTAAIVDDGTTSIDRHAEITIDRSLVDGKYYADKAPGLSLLAIPTYAVAKAATGGELPLLVPIATDFGEGITQLDASPSRVIALRAIVWLTVGLLYALAGAAFFNLALRLGQGARAAALTTFTIFAATPLLGWSAQFFGHVAAASCLMIAMALSAALPSAIRQKRLALMAGLALGGAVSIEYTAAVPAFLIALYVLWSLMRAGSQPIFLLICLGVIGALAGIIPTLIYHSVSFGGPFTVGYSNLDGWEGMNEGFMGITSPSPWALMSILFGLKRGIIWLSPILVVLPFATVLAFRVKSLRPELILATAIILYYVLLNASFHYWNGGSSVGPRHMLPSVMFAGIAMLWAWSAARGLVRKAMLALLALSFAISLAAPLVTMSVHFGYAMPLLDPILTNFFGVQNAFARWASVLGTPITILMAALWVGLCATIGLRIWRFAKDADAQASA